MIERIIRVKTCSECPHYENDNMGDYSPRLVCYEGAFEIDERKEPLKYNIYWKMVERDIHPNCPLEKVKE